MEGEGVVDGGGGGGGGGCGGGSGSGGPSERMTQFYVEMRDEFELAISRAVGQEFDIGNCERHRLEVPQLASTV